MVDFAPGMRTIIRDEEWMIKKLRQTVLVIRLYIALVFLRWSRIEKQSFSLIWSRFKSLILLK